MNLCRDESDVTSDTVKCLLVHCASMFEYHCKPSQIRIEQLRDHLRPATLQKVGEARRITEFDDRLTLLEEYVISTAVLRGRLSLV